MLIGIAPLFGDRQIRFLVGVFETPYTFPIFAFFKQLIFYN